MKNLPFTQHLLPITFLTFYLLTLVACSNDDKPENPVDALPPITQTGENTFACLINGKPFFSSSDRRASYTFADGAYTLGMSGSRSDDGIIKTVSLVGLDIEQSVKETEYLLKSDVSGNFFGRYAIYNLGVEAYVTYDQAPGVLKISKLNLKDGFISGTFEFTAQDEEGNTLNFTDGRFDLKF